MALSDNHLKTPLNLSLNRWASNRIAGAAQLDGKSFPCSVTEVIGSGIVKVKFEVNADPYTLSEVTIPVEAPEYIRYPIQVGDKGLAVSADAWLGAISGLGSGTPSLAKPGNLSALSFIWLGNKDWADPIDPNAVEIYGVGDSGVILHDGNNTVTVTLTASGIVIDTGGNDVTVQGGGNVTVTGGDVTADGISLKTHTHGGVQTGSGNTGEPN